jgi:hypothetical protein
MSQSSPLKSITLTLSVQQFWSHLYVGFEVLTVVGTKMAVFWFVALCKFLADYMALQPRRQLSLFICIHILRPSAYE